ncbi:MAG: DUF5691 domain-containing protein [Pseudomonadota bacterium]
MKLTPSIHKAVLAGVARSPISDSAAAGAQALQGVLGTLDGDMRLWHTVAATDLWQRAGYQPPVAGPAAPASDAAATCSLAAERIVQLILRGIHAELLPEWLTLADKLDRKLPYSALVQLLDMGADKPALRPRLAPLLGERGAWLVAQNPAWRDTYGTLGTPGAGDDHASRWELGTLAQRVQALRAMRRAGPAQARERLSEAWAQEPPEHRAALLPCLAVELTLDDEAFIDAALDDKRKEVRTAAQQLLRALDGSQLMERCKARMNTCLQLKRGMLGLLNQIVVTLPDTCDKAMKRDGIGATRQPGLGEKAGWIVDLMSGIPPTYWSRKFELEPAKIIALMAASEFKEALLCGILQAAASTTTWSADAAGRAWFLALFNDANKHGTFVNPAATLMPALPRLSYADQETIVRGWLDQPAGSADGFGHALAWAAERALTAPLSQEMSRLLLAGAQRRLARQDEHPYHMRHHLATLQTILDAGDAAHARHGWPHASWEHWPHWREMVDELIETLQFRNTMQASFLETDA